MDKVVQPWLCKNGHDKNLRGVSAKGYCRECDRVRYLERSHEVAKSDPNSRYYSSPLTGLRPVRRELGLTQREFAKRAGLSVNFIGSLERGTQRATRKMQRRILETVVELRAEQRESNQRLKKAGLL